MARPITWQDVVAPKQGQNLLAAQQAAKMIQEGLGEAVDAVGGLRDSTKQAATEQAAAFVLQAQDPMAAAQEVAKSAAPFNPLDIAKVANERTGQLQQARAAEATIESSQASTATQRATLQDMQDKRLGAELAQPWLNQIANGTFKGVDETAFKDKGQGGLYAQEAIQKAIRDKADLDLRSKANNLAEKKYNEEQKVLRFMDYAREQGASAEGSLMDDALINRDLERRAKEMGVGISFVDQARAYWQKGTEQALPTDEELNTTVPGQDGKTYRDVTMELSRRQQDVTQQRHAKLAEPINKDDPTSPTWLQVEELSKRTPAFQEGEIAFVAQTLASRAEDMSTSEAKSRINRVQAKYPTLTEAQAADIAFQTQDRWNFWLANPANAPEATALAKAYEELNNMGGAQGVQERIASVTSPFDRELAKLPTVARQVSGSARTRGELTPLASEVITKYRAADAIAKQAAADEEAKKAEKARRKAAIDKANADKANKIILRN